MFSHSFFPCITKPTRVSKTSCTLIDNIFSNDFCETNTTVSGILYTDVSDHFPVYYINYSDSVNVNEMSFKKRIYSNVNMERFAT